MPTKEELSKLYAGYENEKLINIVINRINYTELAYQAAADELSKRKVSWAEIEKYKDEQVAETYGEFNKHLLDELKNWQKVFLFVLFIPRFSYSFRKFISKFEYPLKYKQCKYYPICGFLSLILLVAISEIFNIENVYLLLIGWVGLFILTYMLDDRFNRQKLITQNTETDQI